MQGIFQKIKIIPLKLTQVKKGNVLDCKHVKTIQVQVWMATEGRLVS